MDLAQSFMWIWDVLHVVVPLHQSVNAPAKLVAGTRSSSMTALLV